MRKLVTKGEIYGKILKKHRFLYAVTVIFGAVISLVNVLVAYIIGKMIDNITKGGMEKLQFFIILVVFFIICYAFFGVLYSYLGGLLSRKLLHDIKCRVYKNLSIMPIYKYQEKEVSFFYNMLTHDINEINENYIEIKYDTTASIIAFFVSLAALLSINWLMAIIFIGLTLLIILIPSLLMKFQERSRTHFSSSNEKFMKELENILSGFESLKVLNVSKKLFQKMEKEDRNLEDSRLRRTIIDGGVRYTISSISVAVELLCILVGTYFVIKGKITTGGLIMAVQILNSVVAPINVLFKNKNLINSTKALREKLEKTYCIILDEPTANLDKENTKKIREIIKMFDVPIKIVISHDYGDIYLESFDNVLVMEAEINK